MEGELNLSFWPYTEMELNLSDLQSELSLFGLTVFFDNTTKQPLTGVINSKDFGMIILPCKEQLVFWMRRISMRNLKALTDFMGYMPFCRYFNIRLRVTIYEWCMNNAQEQIHRIIYSPEVERLTVFDSTVKIPIH